MRNINKELSAAAEASSSNALFIAAFAGAAITYITEVQFDSCIATANSTVRMIIGEKNDRREQQIIETNSTER